MNYWDANRTIPIAKDLEKKEGLFCRSRIESDLDTKIDAVLDKLYELYDRSIIDKARIFFGSNLVEVRYRNNPFCPKAFPLDEFLALKIENQFDFEPCDELQHENSIKLFSAFNVLRFKEKEYLEGFSINRYSGNVWAFFSSSSSLITDHFDFLKYTTIRSSKISISHDQALKQAKLFGSGFFHGDPEFFKIRENLKHLDSELDKGFKEFSEIALNMLKSNMIFEIQVYLGSGIIRVITPSEPYTNYAFTGLQEFKQASIHYDKQPMDLQESLANKNLTMPNLRVNRNLVNRAFHVAKLNRLKDENLYLRVFYIDFMYNKILSSFSCGGTRYQSAEEFINEFS